MSSMKSMEANIVGMELHLKELKAMKKSTQQNIANFEKAATRASEATANADCAGIAMGARVCPCTASTVALSGPKASMG